MRYNRNNSDKKEREVYDEPAGTTILELADNKLVQAEVSEFDGVRYFSLRVWIQLQDGSWSRTRNGLSVPSKRAFDLGDELIDYLDRKRKRAA